ncbi:hypothetical protein ACYSNX_11180 [Myroides sp. LJL115]
MKTIINIIPMLFAGLLLSCTNSIDNNLRSNLDGTITIQGRVLVEGTNTPPQGINTLNITNRWIDSNKGENEMAYIDKKGFYRITIQKGDTLKLMPNYLIYKKRIHKHTITDLHKNQIINFTVHLDSTVYKEIIQKSPNSKKKLDKLLNNINPNKLISISGTVLNKNTGKPIVGLPISPISIENAKGLGSFNLTNEYGQFSIRVPQNISVGFNTLHENRSTYVTASKDTILTLTL